MTDQEQMPEPTTAESGEIKAIAKDTVHRICSGQVVLTLAVAVKELVENSVDAGATLVEVKLRDHGLESVEVSDNGCGVHERDLEAMTAKYHTSKIREFVDLQNVETFGFRGEALSSLCALSDLVVATRHASHDVGTRMELDHEGRIKKRSPCARSVGTTVTLTNLFATLPVRRRDFVRNIRKEFNKMCQILQAYCLVARGVRIICSNQTVKGAKLVVMQTHGSQDILANIAAVFGNRQTTELLPLKTPCNDGQDLTEESLRAELQLEVGAGDSMEITSEDIAQLKAAHFQLEGFVSSCTHGAGRSSKDRQYFYINSRPCDLKNISKIVNDTYHRYNSHQYPFVFLNINTARSDVDVNLTPDKRQLLLNNEKILILAIKKALVNTYGDIPSTYKLQNSSIVSMFKKENGNGNVTNEHSTNNETSEDSSECLPISSSQRFKDVLSQWKKTGDTAGKAPHVTIKRKCPDEVEVRTLKLKKIHDYLSRDDLSPSAMPKVLRSHSDSEEDESNKSTKAHTTANEQQSLVNITLDLERLSEESKEFDTITDKVVERIDCKVIRIKPNESNLHFIDKSLTSVSKDLSPNPTDNNGEGLCSDKPDDDDDNSLMTTVILDESIVDAESTINYYSSGVMRITLEEIAQNVKAEEKLNAEEKEFKKAKLERLRFKSEINPSQNEKAEEELQREISKDSFAKMEIIGQFNLGFIIVKLDSDLFIIDQHATDEKYNFEMLQRTTVLQSQPLAVPQSLELTAANEMLLLDHLALFQKNGFKFEINENAPPTKKVKLLCKPSSARWQFGKEDIDELLFMLQDAPAGTVCRPSRIRDMFASRACRKSVMIGTALKRATMKKLVTHMGEIEQPWISENKKDKIIGKCVACNKVIRGFTGVSSNFISHLRVRHPKIHKEYLTKKSKNENLCIQSNFDKKLIEFLVDTGLPLSLVERQSFINLIEGIGLKLMSRQTTIKKLEELHKRMEESVKAELARAKHVCTTADIWSGNYSSFFGYTCHWLDKDFKRKSAALACKRMFGVQSAEAIGHIMSDINTYYGLNRKNIVLSVTGNGSNFVKVFKEYGVDNASEMEDDGGHDISESQNKICLPKHHRCSSHTLSLLATSDLIQILKADESLFQRNNMNCPHGRPTMRHLINMAMLHDDEEAENT